MKKYIYYLTLLFILLLIGLSVLSAFLGAERADRFFNSVPLAAYWILLAVLIIASVFVFRKLHKPCLFLIHAGTLLVILGSMIGSDKGRELSGLIGGNAKPVKTQMVIYEGQSSHELYDVSENRTFPLPFEIRLNDFVVEYYTPTVIVQFPDGRGAEIPARPGTEMVFDDPTVKSIRVTGVFENLKIALEDGQRKAIDSTQPGRNPAVELAITRADGRVDRQFVFELFKGHAPDRELAFTYYRPIKDYISRVDVIQNGVVVKSADLEVNHPLHFGGFHFYQYSYDNKQHQYTVLQVVSDTGLSVVYAGFILLVAGTVWYFWFTRLRGSWR